MDGERGRRILMTLILGVAALLAALEVTLARGSDRTLGPSAPRLAPLEDKDRALAEGDLVSAATARHRAHLAALGSRSWEGFLAVGDAALRLGDASGDRARMKPEARRAYLAALMRARSERSLDGVLRATESFAVIGDREMVEQGIRIARDVAGRDDLAQERIATLAGIWIDELL